jgi:hypothetical protein
MGRVGRSRVTLKLLNRCLVVAAFLVAIAGVLALRNQHTAHQMAVHQALVAATKTMVPSTLKPAPSAYQSYTAPADLARYISIPAIHVQAIVGSVGLTNADAIGTPSNVYDTDWYNGSAKPGQPGAALIDGHVSSWTTNGVFYNLRQLVAGNQIKITRGDGQILNYIVVKVQVYQQNAVDIRALLSPINPLKSGLNLITCTGNIVKGTNEFSQRVVVYTSLE